MPSKSFRGRTQKKQQKAASIEIPIGKISLHDQDREIKLLTQLLVDSVLRCFLRRCDGKSGLFIALLLSREKLTRTPIISL